MFHILAHDGVDADVLPWLPQGKCRLERESARPDVILLRSSDLRGVSIPKSVLAIGRAGSGVNNIPVEECSRRGIPVFNAPGANANAVKELTIAAILLASRNIVAAWDFARNLEGDDARVSKQVESGKAQFDGFELTGKKLGVLGLGAVGGRVANAAIALGMRVYGFDPSIGVERAWKLSPEVIGVSSIDDLLTRADIVTLHIPLDEHNAHFIDASRLALMSRGAILINFSRAGVIDEAALSAALDSGALRAYVTDFPTRAILDRPRAIALPHLGAATAEAEANCAASVADSVVDFLENGEIRNSVNFPRVILPRAGRARLAIANKNIPGVVSRISSALAAANLNIENLLNKSRDEYAFTLVDLDAEPPIETLDGIRRLEGILSVRAVPKSAGAD
ncbi:3-phosphoglycerate dehydrogenase family protein [Methylosinus sp. PW1]|uniref:3-phosphoglycerate dehydrogenase family protein n=1 Tax=Methylosinus sp. PW1 TaxID=107636 RepID=UPI00055B643A|nr:3-phosphoglycerate dehydrogenase family protein [Methylosinus sp. PW1]